MEINLSKFKMLTQLKTSQATPILGVVPLFIKIFDQDSKSKLNLASKTSLSDN